MTLAEWFEANPKVYAEWDSQANTHINPKTDGYAANRKAWWICPEGHHYDTLLQSRTLYGQGCPYCKGKRTLAGYNDLATARSDVLSKWDYEKNTEFTPQEVTEFSHKKVWWKCDKGHSWQARVQSVTMLKDGALGCPYCNGRYAAKGENDLATLRPDLAAQWSFELNDLTPEQVTLGSKRKVFWKCELGHTWQSPIDTRTRNKKAICPYCNNYKLWPGFNDLATASPEIAAEWNFEKNGDLKPSDVSKAARQKVWWKCSEGHEWEALIYVRTKKNGTNCPICSRRKK
ncbi:MAG: zinc-ribbon domain-containing protein [Lachnospiraceae bacterium]|nr:zinc-ribbon domain-containing protein [Lachnospiraceae bacterium]